MIEQQFADVIRFDSAEIANTLIGMFDIKSQDAEKFITDSITATCEKYLRGGYCKGIEDMQTHAEVLRKKVYGE